MSTYYATARSSAFKVRDVAKFKKFCERYRLELFREDDKDHGQLYGFVCPDDGMPSCYMDDDEDWIDVDFEEELSNHVAEGWCAVLMEVGAEKAAYLVGYASIISSDGCEDHINLGDTIFEKADKSKFKYSRF